MQTREQIIHQFNRSALALAGMICAEPGRRGAGGVRSGAAATCRSGLVSVLPRRRVVARCESGGGSGGARGGGGRKEVVW